jgi:hypothetical protein
MGYLKQVPLFGCLLITSKAYATDIVLYRDGLVSELSTQMARIDGLPEDMEYQQFDALLEQHRATLSRGFLNECLLKPEERAQEDLAQRMKRGGAAVQYADYETANEHLTTAEQLLRCATEIVDPAVGARLYLLYAIVAYEQGDESTSRDRFERAFLFEEGLEWDNANPSSSKPLFEEARWSIYDRTPARLYIEPDYGSKLYLNGRIPEAAEDFYLVPQGEHLLQFGLGERTYSVSLESGEYTLSPPITAEPSVFHSEKNTAKSQTLITILVQLFPKNTTIYLMDDKQVWEHRVGSDTFTNRWDEVLTREGNRKKRKIAAWTLVGSGAAVAAGSTAMMLTGLNRANAADEAMGLATNAARDSNSPEDVMAHNLAYDTAFENYTKAYTLNLLGAVSAVGGGMLAGGGITLLATSSSQTRAKSGLFQLQFNLPQRGLK